MHPHIPQLVVVLDNPAIGGCHMRKNTPTLSSMTRNYYIILLLYDLYEEITRIPQQLVF